MEFSSTIPSLTDSVTPSGGPIKLRKKTRWRLMGISLGRSASLNIPMFRSKHLILSLSLQLISGDLLILCAGLTIGLPMIGSDRDRYHRTTIIVFFHIRLERNWNNNLPSQMEIVFHWKPIKTDLQIQNRLIGCRWWAFVEIASLRRTATTGEGEHTRNTI